MFNKTKKITYLSLNTISFEIVILDTNTTVPAFLLLLESPLEVVLCNRIEVFLRCDLYPDSGVQTVFEMPFPLEEEVEVRMC